MEQDKICAALAALQAELTNPTKTKTANVGKYKYEYADLAEIMDHVRPLLARHKLAIVQLPQAEPGRNWLITRLVHESGQYIECTYALPVSAAAQEMGSAITYARRYSVCSILGIAAETDDDGAKANNAPPEEDAIRTQLVELMGEASLGNKAVMDYCKAHGLGEGGTVEALPVESVRMLIATWGDAVTAMKASRKLPKNASLVGAPPPASEEGGGSPGAKSLSAGTELIKQDQPDDLPGLPDLSGLDPDLAQAMGKDTISKAELKAYYVKAGHMPEAMSPERLPKSYITALLANWNKAVNTMKGMK